MPLEVLAFPPIHHVEARRWLDVPVSQSRSLLDPAQEYLSALGTRRHRAELIFSGRSCGGMVAGYLEQLIRDLDGVRAVRVPLWPINWTRPSRVLRASRRPVLTVGGAPADLGADDGPARLATGAVLTGEVFAQNPRRIGVNNLPPHQVVARPGESMRLFADTSDTTGLTVRVRDRAVSSEFGFAWVYSEVDMPVQAYRLVNLGAATSAAWRVTSYEPGLRPRGGDWESRMELREVLPELTPGGFVEVDPWTV